MAFIGSRLFLDHAALPTAFDQLIQPRSPRLVFVNLRLLCRTTQAEDGPVWVRMALVNARSAVNKTFILNDLFTSRLWIFYLLRKPGSLLGMGVLFSELLPGNCTFLNSPRMVRRGGGLATIFKDIFFLVFKDICV